MDILESTGFLDGSSPGTWCFLSIVFGPLGIGAFLFLMGPQFCFMIISSSNPSRVMVIVRFFGRKLPLALAFLAVEIRLDHLVFLVGDVLNL